MCVAALVGYLAFPTYPTYDSFYALLWGRDLLHGHLPDLQRLPRPHRAPAGDRLRHALLDLRPGRRAPDGARLDRLVRGRRGRASTALGRLAFGPLVGLIAALLLLSRFFVENLAAQGYLDVSYLALILWALALELERPRRGTPVFLLLAAAGLLRPDAWVLSGVYWLWCCWPGCAPGAPHRGPSVRRMAPTSP